MKKIIRYLLFFCVLFLLTCTKDAFSGYIHPEIMPFIERFVEEGRKRGVAIDIAELETYLVNEFSVEREPTVCGLGWSVHRNNRRRVEILNSNGCWANRSDIEKENLVFHELGHAILERNHINTTLPNRRAKSIMCSADGEIGCSALTVYYDNEPLRSYYLDELFNPNTPLPDFANRITYNRTVFEEGQQSYLTDWEMFPSRSDDDISGFQFTQDTSATGIPSTITFSTAGSTAMDTLPSALIVKRFEIDNFSLCSNLRAFADIQAEGITDGSFQVGLSLRERITPDSLQRFFIDVNGEEDNRFYNNYLHELYCLPERADVVSISFTLRSKTPASITIDDLFIDLYE